MQLAGVAYRMAFYSKWVPQHTPIGFGVTNKDNVKKSVFITQTPETDTQSDLLVRHTYQNEHQSVIASPVQIGSLKSVRSQKVVDDRLKSINTDTYFPQTCYTDDPQLQKLSDILDIDCLLDEIMYQTNTVDCENFQDLGNWCSPLLTDDPNLKETEKVDMIEENTATPINTHSLHTWNSIDSTIKQEGDNYSFSPTDAFSPSSDLNTPGIGELNMPFDNRFRVSADTRLSVENETYDISKMNVVFEMPSSAEPMNALSPCFDKSNHNSPESTDDIEWLDVFDTIKTDTYTSGNIKELHAVSPRTQINNTTIMDNDQIEIIENEASITENMEMLSWGNAYPAHSSGDYVVGNECMLTNRTKQCNDMIVAEFILSGNEIVTEAVLPASVQVDRTPKLNLNVNLKPMGTQRYTLDGFKFMDPIVTTPDVLRAVEELEADKKLPPRFFVEKTTLNETRHTNYAAENHEASDQELNDNSIKEEVEEDGNMVESNVTSPDSYSPSANNVRSHKGSDDDSDESYTPPSEKKPVRKYRKRKVTLPQEIPATPEKKARRGRPPKRRESVASTYTTDDNMSSMSVESSKYRELRDKNNEASRRSRMNRKYKEQEMEKMADDLEEKNKTLKLRAEMLESVTKRLKDALMSAILNK